MSVKPSILVVEDNPGDQILLRQGLEAEPVNAFVQIVNDGEKAIRFLLQQSPYAQAPRPDLVVLDLNLPKKDGRTVLREIRATPTFRFLPVVILTSSDSEEDVRRSYEACASSYFTKPDDPERFFALMGRLKRYWLEDVRLPRNS